MNITPLFDRVLVKEIQIDNQKSPLILQASSEDKPIFGKVLKTGSGIDEEGKQIKMQIKKDDTVVFSKYCALSIRLDGDELFILRQSDILGILGE